MVDFLRNSLLFGSFLTFLFGLTICEKLIFQSEYRTDDRNAVRNQGGDFHLSQLEKTADFHTDINKINVYKQDLSVPHYGNVVYIDIIQNVQVELLLEEEISGDDHVHFQLQTYVPYIDQISDVYLHHTARQDDNGLHVTVHIADQSAEVLQPVYSVTLVLVSLVVLLATVLLHRNCQQKNTEFSPNKAATCNLDATTLQAVSTSKEACSTTSTQIKLKSRRNFKTSLFEIKNDGLAESLTQNVDETSDDVTNDEYRYLKDVPTIKDNSASPRIHGNQENNMGPFSHHRLKSLPFPVLVCLCVTLTVAVVFALKTVSSRHLLKVGIPNTVSVRKVRSYSENPDLAGININTLSIGLITRIQLIDVSQSCTDNLTLCQTHAVCDTDSGSLTCICKRGFYVDKQTCKECSTSCPDGYYMLQPCTGHSNIVCKACTECGETSYEAAPCRTTHDRICLDVSFPVNHIKWRGTSPLFSNTSIDVTSSDNVFVEKVRNMKDIHTPLYVTNNQQLMAYVANTPSGLEVQIKVSGIFLVPTYVDLDHMDDSPFFLTYREPDQVIKEQYRKIQKQYCRHPLPDHYKMILEVIRNFTSSASYTTCDSSSSSMPRCSDTYRKGNKYLNRNIDDQCPKTQDRFERLQKHTNVIYCPYNTSLLTRTFGLNPTEIEDLTFLTPECRRFIQDCKRCLHSSTCSNNKDVSSDGDCCSIPCYNHLACSQAYSSSCPKQPVECASGDVYMFILEPLFESLSRRYMCHLKYIKPIQLYQVDYQVTIPSLQYSLKKKQYVVKAENKSFHQQGRAHFDFLSAEHNSFLDLHDEVILVGNRFRNDEAQEFKIYPLKLPSDFNTRKKFNVRPGREDINRNVYSTHVQLERPFLYSSSTWHRGGCENKNFSQLYPTQHIYRHDPTVVDTSILKMDDYFEYQVTSEVPYIRIYLKGDESVLKYYEEDLPKSQINASSLYGNLMWYHGNQTWLITIKGTLSMCPAYISTDVYDKYMVALLGHFDIFVKCPPKFQLSFNLRHPRNDTPDVFIVILNDSSTNHRLVLSLIDRPVILPINETQGLIMLSTSEYPWIPIIVTFVLTVLILSAFLLLGLYIGNKKQGNSGKIVKHFETVTFIDKDEDSKLDGSSTVITKPMSKGVICILLTLYILYALTFTFSMLLGIFYMFQGSLVMNLTIVSNTSAKVQEVVKSHFLKNENLEKIQSDFMLNQTNQRLESCSNHIEHSVKTFIDQLDKITQDQVVGIYGNNQTLTNLIIQNLEDKNLKMKDKLDQFIEEYNKTIQNHYNGILVIYTEFLKEVSTNGWIKFPLDTFISQMDTVEEKLDDYSLIEFMEWLEVEKVSEVLNIKNKLLAKLLKSFSTKDLLLMDPKQGDSSFVQNKIDTIMSRYVQHHFILSEDTIFKSEPTSGLNSSVTNNGPSDEWTTSDKASLINSMKTVFFPVFISVFLFMDILLLMYRFSWLRQVLSTARLGMEEKVPTDHVASKIHFILTGNDIEQSGSTLDKPYSYYMENKESILAGKNEFMLLYCRASPKSKEDILRELWDHKLRQKQKSSPQLQDDSCWNHTCIKFIKYIYKHLISPILWRFVLVGVFVLIICLVTKATNDIVTIETATFLMDTNSILPQVHRQISFTNNMLSGLTADLNNQLLSYKIIIDEKIAGINSFIQETLLQQNSVIETIIYEMCLNKGENSCDRWLPKVNFTEMVISCNFLPLDTQLLTDFNDYTFMHFVHSELYPLVSTLRTILYNTCYILFAYACFMLICHMFIRLILLYLMKNKQLPKRMMYLVSNANDCWKETQSNAPKDGIYRTNSWIESCESGVVGDIDDHLRESNM